MCPTLSAFSVTMTGSSIHPVHEPETLVVSILFPPSTSSLLAYLVGLSSKLYPKLLEFPFSPAFTQDQSTICLYNTLLLSCLPSKHTIHSSAHYKSELLFFFKTWIQIYSILEADDILKSINRELPFQLLPTFLNIFSNLKFFNSVKHIWEPSLLLLKIQY